MYGRNDIELHAIKRNLFLTDQVSDGAYIDIKEGDIVVIWAKRWFQMLYTPSFKSNAGFLLRTSHNKLLASRLALGMTILET